MCFSLYLHNNRYEAFTMQRYEKYLNYPNNLYIIMFIVLKKVQYS